MRRKARAVCLKHAPPPHMADRNRRSARTHRASMKTANQRTPHLATARALSHSSGVGGADGMLP